MTAPSRARLHVRPRLRAIGALMVPDWLAITIGSHIWSWRGLSKRELAHELAHTRQWRRHGARFPFLYLAESVRIWRRGGDWYRDNRFEREASATERARRSG